MEKIYIVPDVTKLQQDSDKKSREEVKILRLAELQYREARW